MVDEKENTVSNQPKRLEKKPWNSMNSTVFWSECRDSNSRPLEPHSSAIPNFATPGYLLINSALKYINTVCEKCQALIFIFSAISYHVPHSGRTPLDPVSAGTGGLRICG